MALHAPPGASGPVVPAAPLSARCARNALNRLFRYRTSKSRVSNTIADACCSAHFTAAKRIVGRWAASRITSASAASFFCRLTNGFHVGRGDQAHPVAESADLPRPVMGAATRLHHHFAGRRLGQKSHALLPPHPPPKQHPPVSRSSVQLKHVLGQIHADDANFTQGRLLCQRSNTPPPTLAHQMLSRGDHPITSFLAIAASTSRDTIAPGSTSAIASATGSSRRPLLGVTVSRAAADRSSA